MIEMNRRPDAKDTGTNEIHINVLKRGRICKIMNNYRLSNTIQSDAHLPAGFTHGAGKEACPSGSIRKHSIEFITGNQC